MPASLSGVPATSDNIPPFVNRLFGRLAYTVISFRKRSTATLSPSVGVVIFGNALSFVWQNPDNVASITIVVMVVLIMLLGFLC